MKIQRRGMFNRGRLSKNNGRGNGQLQTDSVTAFRLEQLPHEAHRAAAITPAPWLFRPVNSGSALRLQGRPPRHVRSNKTMEPHRLDILNRFNARRGQKELLTSGYDLRLVSNKRSGRSRVQPPRLRALFLLGSFLCAHLECKSWYSSFIKPRKMLHSYFHQPQCKTNN